jgi:single-stranded-DNA-specific exonuclease
MNNQENLKTIESLEELDELLSKRILDNKIKTYDDFKNLLNTCQDPELDKAVDILYENIINKKRIIGIHDSDVDGLSTATLAYRFFKTFIPYGVKIEITDRKQGYGFLPLHVDNNKDANLFYTADNGITSFEACKYAKELGKQVIINDHHQPEEINGKKELPIADAIVDPFIHARKAVRRGTLY